LKVTDDDCCESIALAADDEAVPDRLLERIIDFSMLFTDIGTLAKAVRLLLSPDATSRDLMIITNPSNPVDAFNKRNMKYIEVAATYYP